MAGARVREDELTKVFTGSHEYALVVIARFLLEEKARIVA
jgi:hypothetical protein